MHKSCVLECAPEKRWKSVHTNQCTKGVLDIENLKTYQLMRKQDHLQEEMHNEK